MRHRLACLEQCRNVLRAFFNSTISFLRSKRPWRRRRETQRQPAVQAGDTNYGNAKVALALLDVRDALAVLSGITDRVSQCRNLANPHPVVNDLIAAAEQGNVARYREQLARLAAASP